MPSNVYAVAVAPNWDVYAGGFFTNAGGNPDADTIARWNGTAWHNLGGGLNATVRAIRVLANGDVVAGGDFGLIPGTTGTQRLVRWTGTTWQWVGLVGTDSVKS